MASAAKAASSLSNEPAFLQASHFVLQLNKIIHFLEDFYHGFHEFHEWEIFRFYPCHPFCYARKVCIFSKIF
jgi:hypothetical protein